MCYYKRLLSFVKQYRFIINMMIKCEKIKNLSDEIHQIITIRW